MKKAILKTKGEIILFDVPMPQPENDLVLLRVKACGICQTDYKAYIGLRPNLKLPVVMGHEFSGIVEKNGSAARYYNIGEEVIVSPVISCGICQNCRNGNPHYCKDGSVIGGDGMDTIIDGAFSEYILVPEKCLYRKPKNITFEAAALAEPLAGSYKGLIEYSQLKIGEDLVIIGAGSMGLLATMIAIKNGAGNIIVIDKNEWRLEFAKKIGASYIINTNKEDPIKAVYNILPNGPDLVFEAAGPPEAFEMAYKLCRRGSRLNEFGVTTIGNIPVSPVDIHFKEIRIDASFTVTPMAIMKSIQLMEKGIIDPTKIITHKFNFKDINQAMKTMAAEERIKIILTM